MDDAGPFCDGPRSSLTPPPAHSADPQFDISDYD
jgi:hypothetical protein